MTEFLRNFIYDVNYFILYYFLALNACYLFSILLSSIEMQKYLRRTAYSGYDLLFSDLFTPSISILVPANNEEANIEFTVKNLLHLRYPKYEVIVINDGSGDRTLEVLIKVFRLLPIKFFQKGTIETKLVRTIYYSLDYPNLRVIDKENGGKADALNAGINTAQYDYFLSVDADAILEEDSLLKIIRPVVEDMAHVVAVGGIVRIANGCKIEKGRITIPKLSTAFLPRFQVIEYFRAFLTARTALSMLNANLIISGAFGLFRKDVVLKLGGYRLGTVGEDMEIVTAIQAYSREFRKDFRIVFIGDPVCWTEAPATLKILSRQRRRWQRGLFEVLRLYRKMLFSPRYGWVGLYTFPFLFLFEGWGSIIEVAGYATFLVSFMMGWVGLPFAMTFFSASILLGIVFSISALILEEYSFKRYHHWSDLFALIMTCVLENFGYRQLISFFRFQGAVDYIRKKTEWGEMERQGVFKSSKV